MSFQEEPAVSIPMIVTFNSATLDWVWATLDWVWATLDWVWATLDWVWATEDASFVSTC